MYAHVFLSMETVVIAFHCELFVAYLGPGLVEKPAAIPDSPVSHFTSGGRCQGSTEVFIQIRSNLQFAGLNGPEDETLHLFKIICQCVSSILMSCILY